MTKSYFNIREALEVGSDQIVDAYKKATPGEVVEAPEDNEPASPDEAGMAMDQAKFIGYVAEEIMEYIQGNNEFPEWMQNKLSAFHQKAKDMHAVMAGKYNESVEVNEAMDQKKFSAGAKALTVYAKKNGGIDKADFMKAAKMLDQIGRVNILQAGQLLSQLNRFVDGLDTDVRERIYVELKKVGLVESVQEANKPMKSRFGGAVDSKKFDAYKKFVKQHNVDEPTVRMVIDNPNDAESKRMMKIANIAKAVELRKAAMKESVQEAKVECPKCKGEGCDHCDGKGYHMTEAKQKNWMVTVTKPINKLKKGMKVVVPARNTAEAIKKALKRMGENPAAIGSGHLDVKLDEGLEEKYRAPTKAEIEADKKKDQKGKSRPSISAKSVNKKQYGNMMGRLKEKELEEAKFTPKEIKMAIGIASDPRYKGGNMTGATKAIDKIKKGLSDYPQVAAVLKRQNESVDLEEKLQVSDGMKKWIEDFQKSDASQFEGMDKNERREMAIAAYLAAKRRDKKED